MRARLTLENPPVNTPADRKETIRKITDKIIEWSNLSETEPVQDEMHAG